MMRKSIHSVAVCLVSLILLNGCGQKEETLPVLGRSQVVEKEVNGKTVKDTLPHRIPAFSFTDQKGREVTHKTFDENIYVADFFFTSCPTICPTMTEQMHRVYEKYEDEEKVRFLSHTVDPKRDTPATLKAYADKLDIDHDKWRFVTGNMDSIYRVGKKGYMASARKDSTAPGGFLHSGQFFLIDEKRQIRGIYNGTKKKSVDKLIEDMDKLL